MHQRRGREVGVGGVVGVLLNYLRFFDCCLCLCVYSLGRCLAQRGESLLTKQRPSQRARSHCEEAAKVLTPASQRHQSRDADGLASHRRTITGCLINVLETSSDVVTRTNKGQKAQGPNQYRVSGVMVEP